MNNLEKAIKLITDYNELYSVNEYVPLKTTLQAIELAAKQNWKFPVNHGLPEHLHDVLIVFVINKNKTFPAYYDKNNHAFIYQNRKYKIDDILCYLELPIFENKA